jgi:hypothetical protein
MKKQKTVNPIEKYSAVPIAVRHKLLKKIYAEGSIGHG